MNTGAKGVKMPIRYKYDGYHKDCKPPENTVCYRKVEVLE